MWVWLEHKLDSMFVLSYSGSEIFLHFQVVALFICSFEI
jgi:hypothetical protein